MISWKDQTREAALNIYDYAQSFISPTVRLGVTGLARSGKTVFITSLIYHLLHRQNLSFFEPAASGRIERVYLEPHPDDMHPRFDYEGNLEQLTNPHPTWPESTRQISQLRLTIDYISNEWQSRLLGPSKLHIDIVDYPGEWLIDLALLEKDYASWCAEIITEAERTPTTSALEAWRTALAATTQDSPLDEGAAKTLNKAFLALLNDKETETSALKKRCPGRFLMPGDLEGAPALTFAPLPLNNSPIKDGTLAALMQRRFEAYKENIAKPFYLQFFTRLDRQIILVDLLSALKGGPADIDALEKSLQGILQNFNPGARHWLTSIWNKKIDRLVFAATKADHLHHQAHDQLQDLLSYITSAAITKAEMSGASVKVQALAALKTTKEVEIEQAGQTYSALKGTPLKGETFENQTFDGNREIHFYPGALPTIEEIKNKTAAEKITELYSLNFAPPNPQAQPKMPHIRLDRALNMLIGDKLK